MKNSDCNVGFEEAKNLKYSTLQFVEQPKTRTRSQFIEERKAKLISENDMSYWKMNPSKHEGERARIDKREEDRQRYLVM